MATSTPASVLDITGFSLANRKIREPYSLPVTDSFIRAISPVMGCFFTRSVYITDRIRKKDLKFGIDYIFTEIYSSLSTIYKQGVAATIVFINREVSNDVEISYNFLGAQYTQVVTGIANAINIEANNGRASKLQWSIINQIKPFIPPDYAKQIGAGVGFETVVYGLESLRSTILYGGYNLDDSIAQYIDEFIAALNQILNNLVDFSYKDKLEIFLAQLTKAKLGLDKFVNMGLVSKETAKFAAVRDYQFEPNKNGYVAIKAISSFKSELYNNLVNSEHTGIGKHYGIYGLPLLETLFSMRNGAGIIINSLESLTVSGFDFNRVVYPDTASPSNQWSIVKMTNNATGQGGVLWGTNMDTGELYVGQLRNEIDHPQVLTWVKLYGEYDMQKALNALTDHIHDFDNPHKTNKHQLDLGNVENLPLANYEDLSCRVPSQKYVSHKFLLAFMSTYMTGLKTAGDLKEMNYDDNEVIRNIKLIFAPCGPCGPCCEPNLVPVNDAITTSIPIVDPAGQLTSWFCDGGKRWDVITDGFGGTKTIEHLYLTNDPKKVADGCVFVFTTLPPTTTTGGPVTVPPPTTTTTTTTTPGPTTVPPVTTTTTTTTEEPVTTTTTTTTPEPTTTTTTTSAPKVYALTHHVGVYNDEIDIIGNGIARDGYTNYPDFIGSAGYANHHDTSIFTDEFIWDKVKSDLFKLDRSLNVPVYYALTGTLEEQPETETPGYLYAFPWKQIDIHKNYFLKVNTDESSVDPEFTRSSYLNKINNDAIFIPFKVANWTSGVVHSKLHFELELLKVARDLTSLMITTFDTGAQYTYSGETMFYVLEGEAQATQDDINWFNERVTVSVRNLSSSTQPDNFVESDINGGALFVSGTTLVTEDNGTENGAAGLYRLNIVSEENGNIVIAGLEFMVALYGARYFKIGDTNTEISFGTMLSVLNVVPLSFTEEEKYTFP